MKLDLCKIFEVEEGEEFRIGTDINPYRIYNNSLQYLGVNIGIWNESSIGFNYVTSSKITKLPKKKEFTDDELCILMNIDKKYKWIARDEDGELYLFKEEPCKALGVWETKSVRTTEFLCYNYLFQSITSEDEEPVFIDDYVERQLI